MRDFFVFFMCVDYSTLLRALHREFFEGFFVEIDFSMIARFSWKISTKIACFNGYFDENQYHHLKTVTSSSPLNQSVP